MNFKILSLDVLWGSLRAKATNPSVLLEHRIPALLTWFGE